MSTDTEPSLLRVLEAWEERYHVERTQLSVQDIDALRTILARLTEQIQREATGPSTVPQPLREDG